MLKTIKYKTNKTTTNNICIHYVITLSKTSIKTNAATDEGNSRNET